MATQITNYQCPACTGPLNYSADSGKLECEYCGSSYSVEEVEALYAAKDEAAAEAKAQADTKAASLQNEWGDDAAHMKAYSCPSCGAELICDESTAATSCPYCGNPTVVPGQFSGSLKPDYVIPFKIEKETAVEALKNHCKGKVLLPKIFASQNQIEKIQGVYVPFWLFDGEAEGGVCYDTTRSRSYRRGDYQITETDHFVVEREGSIAFERVPVDASSKMPDDYMDSIEPFDYSALRPFSTAYLPGYLADRFDMSVDDCRQRVDERFERSFKDAMASTVIGYSTVIPRSADIGINCKNVRYALMPVWLLSTRWNGKNYLFAVNGQTGKLVGDLPMDKRKFWTLFAAITAVAGAIATVIVHLAG